VQEGAGAAHRCIAHFLVARVAKEDLCEANVRKQPGLRSDLWPCSRGPTELSLRLSGGLQRRKVKRANGEIVSIKEIFERYPEVVKNFGMWLRYDSRSGTHNMYKEYRDTTLTGAVAQMYEELSGRHRARKSCIQIVRTAELKDEECKRPVCMQFHAADLKFRLNHRLSRPSSKKYRKTFKAVAPTSFF